MVADVVGNALDELLIFDLVLVHHGLSYGSHDFLFIEADGTAVALNYCLYHTIEKLYCSIKIKKVISF